MSEPKMISPMLDNFIMGGTMSEHHGVSCYPAIENETGNRYIVKIISVPAAQTQLDALLLTGAYTDMESALAYFKNIADDTMAEVDTLEKLTELEGFIAYTASQIVPKETGDGFDIYLLSPYKRTLQRHLVRHSFTHLDALNLGLDMCAALSVSRRLGYLYVDLKPSNVFVNDQRLFRIGDLGFMRLDSLKYASLPEKYISIYTPPEIRDAFSDLNTTMDVYAAGLILYQAYNNGELPFKGDVNPGDPLPAPLYADYEMSEIILKACAPNPEDRWQDPTQMGQAIISYMQRNGATDTPIVPVTTPEPVEDPDDKTNSVKETDTEVENDQETSNDTDTAQGAEVSVEPTNEPPEQSDESVLEITDTPDVIVEDIEIHPSSDANTDSGVIITEDSADEMQSENDTEDEISTPDSDTSEDSAVDNGEVTEDSADSVATDVEQEFVNDKSDSSEDDEEEIFDPDGEIAVTEEVSEILNQADELAAMDVPEPVVVPEHVDVPVPENVPTEEEPAPEIEETQIVETAEEKQSESDVEEEISNEAPDEEDETEVPPARKRHVLRNILLAVVLLAVIIGGFFFYKYYYLLPIESLTVEGSKDTLTVYVNSEIDETLLTVVCSDTYGNKIPVPVVDGKADFTGLVPNTAYTVKVTIKGFHRLTGNAKTTYSTPVQSKVVQFNAVTGTTDDSAILSFTVEGPNVDNWTVYYATDGEEEKSAVFTSQMATITGLTVGKEYTFRLVPEGDLYIGGQSTIQFTPRGLVLAENLRVTSCVNNTLSVAWDKPEDASVTNWSVHCYNDTYNQTITTTDTVASFSDLDSTAGYTIEVKAAGMSVGQAATVSANSITAENFTIDNTDPTKLTFSWVTSQAIPDGGWLLRYSITGIDNVETIPCSANTVTIAPIIPNATYKVQLEDTNGNVLLGSVSVIKTDEPVTFKKEFADFTAQPSDLEFTMVRRPSSLNWGRVDLKSSDYRTNFTIGEHAGYLIRFGKLRDKPDTEATILIVIRDQGGNPIYSNVQVNTWKKMWEYSYFKMSVPALPGSTGEYIMQIYFDGMLVHEQPFAIQ